MTFNIPLKETKQNQFFSCKCFLDYYMSCYSKEQDLIELKYLSMNTSDPEYSLQQVKIEHLKSLV